MYAYRPGPTQGQNPNYSMPRTQQPQARQSYQGTSQPFATGGVQAQPAQPRAPDMSAYGRAQPVQPQSYGTPYSAGQQYGTRGPITISQQNSPYANMQPGVYGMDGRMIPGNLNTALNTANQQQAAMVQLLNQHNAPLSFFGNALGMDMGPQTPDMQSMLKQAQQMVAGGWQNPMQRYFEEADATQQRALRQPPQQEAIRQPSVNRNAIQDLFTQNNIQAPQGFLDQLIGLLGGNAPQPQLPTPGRRPAPGAPDSYYPGFDPRTQDQYGGAPPATGRSWQQIAGDFYDPDPGGIKLMVVQDWHNPQTGEEYAATGLAPRAGTGWVPGKSPQKRLAELRGELERAERGAVNPPARWDQAIRGVRVFDGDAESFAQTAELLRRQIAELENPAGGGQYQYGRPSPRPIAPQQGLTYADYMRAGSPGMGQIQTNDFMQWDDEKGNLIQGSPTAKAAYEQWVQSQKAPRAITPDRGRQGQRYATNMPQMADPPWRKTWGMPALPGQAQPIQPPSQGTPYRQPESVSLAEQRFDLEDVDEAAFNVLRFAARGHYVDDDDYSKAYSEYLQNYKALKPYGRAGTKISYRDFANRASKLRDIYTQENAIAEQKDKAARAAAKNAQTRSGLDARVQKFVAWSDDWRSAGDFWDGLMPIERAELTAAGIGTTELEALINKHRKAGRGGSELKKHRASSNRPPIPTPEQAAMLSRYATGETGFEAAIRASGWTGPLIYTGPWS